MRKKHLKYIVCPDCKGEFILEIKEQEKGLIKSGLLKCSKCYKEYPIINHIPRFVPLDNYTESFGFEWEIHGKTHYDSFSKTNVCETRFFGETKWPRDLKEEIMLEVGCGAGRLTEQAISTGAMIVSMDICAVDINYEMNGNKNNVLIIQADIYNMPFKNNYFNKIFCFGTLQFTPNVKKAFMKLPKYLKQKGNLVIDVFAKRYELKGILFKLLETKYLIRPLTKNIPLKKLYKGCKGYVELMWPIMNLIDKIPYFNKYIGYFFLFPYYRGRNKVKDENLLKKWAVCQIFNMLSPKYDNPQSIKTIKSWFNEAKLEKINIHYGFNGIEGHGTK